MAELAAQQNGGWPAPWRAPDLAGRLKLYFQPPTSRWCVESGFLKSWEKLMAAAPNVTGRYAIVGRRSAADICVAPWGEQFASGLGAVLKPLSRHDVETIVWDTGDRPTGRQSGFYCSLGRGLFDPARHCSISYPVIFNEFIEQAPFEEAGLDFGFVGSMTAGVRRRLMQRFGPIAARLNATMADADYVVPWQKFAHAAVDAKRTDADFIRRTRFVLCPRGQGVSSIRLFEVMKSGRVPVIISDAFVPPALQGRTGWTDAAIFVREHEIETIPAVVGEHLASWETMAANARRLWEGTSPTQP